MDCYSTPNVIRRTGRTSRAPTRSIILIVRPLARHTRDVRETLNWQGHIVIRVRDLIVIVDRRIVAHSFDQVDGFLMAPTDRPVTAAACGHKDRFTQGGAVGVSHRDSLAPVTGCFHVGAAGCNRRATRCHFAG